MLLGAGMFAYVVGSVCGIIANMGKETAEYQGKMDTLNAYLDEYSVPAALRNQVRAYYIHSRNLRKQLSYKEVVGELSQHLTGKLYSLVYSDTIANIPFFHAQWTAQSLVPRREIREQTQSFLRLLAMRLEPVCFGPLEEVVRVGSAADAMFFIKSGLAGRAGYLVKSGRYFGDDMLLTDYTRPYCVRSLSFLDCFKLNRDGLMHVLDSGHFPAIKVTVCAPVAAAAVCVSWSDIPLLLPPPVSAQKTLRSYTIKLIVKYKVRPYVRSLRG